MKKIFTLFAALMVTFAITAANPIVLTPKGQSAQTQTNINTTIDGVTLKFYGSITDKDFRVFASQDGGKSSNDLTISYSQNITKVEISGTSKGGDITAAPGKLTQGTEPLLTIDGINAKSVVISVMKQLKATQITIYTEGATSGDDNSGDSGDTDNPDNPGDTEDPVIPGDTLTVAQAIAIAKAQGSETSTETYIVKGYVTYSYGYKEKYDNIDLFIADTPEGGKDFEIFRAKMVGAEPQVGDLVVGTGNITSFTKEDGTVIYEITNGTVEVLVAGEGGGNDTGNGDDTGSGDTGDGDIDYEDPFWFEPSTPTTVSHNFTDYGDYVFSEGTLDLWIEDEESAMELLFFVDQIDEKTILPVGTYPINQSQEANTLYASEGEYFDEDTWEIYDIPSYYYTDYKSDEDGEGYTKGYYFASGTATVTAEGNGIKIVVAAKSHFGSTLNFTYTGSLVEYTAIENVEMNNSNTRKVLENGQIVIIRNDIRYNILGTQL